VRLGAVVFPALIIIFLVAAPNILLRYVPPQILVLAKEAVGIDIAGMVLTVTVTGVVLAILSLVKNLAEDWSPVKLLSSVASSVTWLYLFLFLIGVGNPLSLGLVKKDLSPASILGSQVSGVTATATIDLRFFAALFILIALLSIMGAYLRFSSSRKARQAPPPP